MSKDLPKLSLLVRLDDSEEEPIVKVNNEMTIKQKLGPVVRKGSIQKVIRSSLSADLQEVLELLNNWASDPTFVIRKILLSLGYPDFPSDQWLQLIKGLAVDLNKVLGAHYSTEVNSRQTQDIRDIFQLSIKLPHQTKSVRTHGEWIIAFLKIIQAVSYILPPRWGEFESPIKNTFASIISPSSRTCEPFFSPHMIWVPVPVSKEEKDFGNGAKIPQEGKTCVITGTEAPAISLQANASMNTTVMSATAMEIIDDQTVRKLDLMNEKIGEGPQHK
ncbi:hypothetical protein HD554DRAFT_2039914 [Boletus coccyginus]|nr:hypothetical protein HD554DRAFT_2039914 [Boletus coccyginus]